LNEAVAVFLTPAMELDPQQNIKIIHSILEEIKLSKFTPEEWIKSEYGTARERMKQTGLADDMVDTFISHLSGSIDVLAGITNEKIDSKVLDSVISQLYKNIKIYLLTCGDTGKRIDSAIEKLTVENGPTDNILINSLIYKALTPKVTSESDDQRRAVEMVWGQAEAGGPPTEAEIARCIDLSKYPLFQDEPLEGEEEKYVELSLLRVWQYNQKSQCRN
jgi:hypothetical protein